MKNTRIIAILVLMALSLSGCANVDRSEVSAPSSQETVMTEPVQSTIPQEITTFSVSESTEIPAESTAEPEPLETKPEVSTPTKEETPPTVSGPTEIAPPKAPAPELPEEPTETQPQESEPPAAEEPAEPAFDIQTWIDYINSFRRLQNVMLRQIVSLDTGHCPCCGGEMRGRDNQMVCDNCNQMMLTKTICPNPDCRHEYYYLSFDVSAETLSKMKDVDPDNFYQVDSLYQYKDIVNMSVDTGKIRTICPHCGQ